MSDEYEVERIVSKKIGKDGRPRYFIKWKDWSEDTNTWEPEEHLSKASKLLADFNASWKGKSETKTSDGTASKTAKKSKRAATDKDVSVSGKKNSLEYAIPEECGFDKGYVPEKIVGATDTGGSIKFLIKWKDKNDDVELITNERARKHCPQLVIKFYEQNIQWDEN